MSRDRRTLTLSTLRDAAALSTIGLLAKAMGLVVTVLVARFLGPEGLGLFALLLAAALLLEEVARFGLPDLLIREVAARPELAGYYWRGGLRRSLATSMLPVTGLVLAAIVAGTKPELRYSLLLIAASMPLAAAAGVGQSVLQAQGKVLFVTWVSFVARATSLVVLVGLLYGGMGITAAFVSRVVFAGGMGIVFAMRLFGPEHAVIAPPIRDSLLKRSLPFAVSRVIGEANLRTPLALVSIAFSLAEVGLFDAADRVGLSFQAISGVGVTALVPVFARSVAKQDADKDLLIAYSIKYAALLVAAGGFLIAAFARPLTALLFGRGFSQTADLLPVLLLSQAVFAADAVVRQALVAHGREYTVIGSGTLALLFKVVLIAALSAYFQLPGAAWGVLLAIIATLSIDLFFALRARISLDIPRFVLRPMVCILTAFGILWLLRDQSAVLGLLLGLAAFLIVAGVFRVFPAQERGFIREALDVRARDPHRGRSSGGPL